jgi:hypothetical protein
LQPGPYNLVVVPEPSAWALWAGGVAILFAGLGRRRNQIA